MSKNTKTPFLSLSEIDLLQKSTGGTPWALISKETGEFLGAVKTRTLAREFAPELKAKVEKFDPSMLPKEESKKVEGKKSPQKKTPEQKNLPEVPDAPKEGFNDFNPGVNYLTHPQDCQKCPLCGSKEIYSGRIDPKDIKAGNGMGTVIDEGLVGGCHHCDWEYNLIDVNRAKSIVENPTRLAWDIADAMLLEPRKEVVKAMIAAGIANGTSRTQYQYWFNVNKDRKHKAIADHNAKLAKEAKSSK